MRTQCRPPILSYLRTKVCGLIFGIRTLLHMHVFVCASICEFDEIPLRGEECTTQEKFNFFLKMVKR